ncbi:GNAT family N-acetyltransferase [Paenibacillus sp. TRM 82003]|nr:GNAT family N-acetyltransferase [Paenibacillus sp. TRM 82003]
MTTILWFDNTNLDAIPWPDTAYGRYAKAVLVPYLRRGPDAFVANARAKLWIASVDGIPLPITANEAEYGNSYVCSPYTHYVRYAKEELSLLGKPWLERALSALLAVTGAAFRSSRINRVVHINNWLLSTNLYPVLTPKQLEALLSATIAKFPGHAVLFRSLNRTTTPEALDALSALGCLAVPSRQIYLYAAAGEGDPRRPNAKARWLVKRDAALLARHGYRVIRGEALSESHIPRIVDLYNQLYLEKYSYDNPRFTPEFVALALREEALSIYALEKNGTVDAVLGFFERDGVMTTPLFGYDTSLPQEVGLYRMLSAVLLGIAEERGALLHESAGAALFKRNRGAFADFEYSAVYTRHLPMYRSWCWRFLGALLNRVGVPLMRKLKL